ncbi:ASCH domain-containing protein [Amycolatopsis nigrescens]|uniref:ASCH domain-containing protein n=1 Tax=Amycolatopsis nigrescens TaxID=381445 RepID=UPI0003803A85|nr:ASCH domain-containing protein [Amycolatopsis nigrescens]
MPEPTEPARRALSIRQPWAALILAGHKPVENRTWATGYRGRLIVHTGRQIDQAMLDVLAEHGITGLPTGAYLGSVQLIGVHHADDCGGCTPWSEPGVWHWCLTRPRVLTEPIPGPGQLGLFTPPPAVLAAVTAVEKTA